MTDLGAGLISIASSSSHRSKYSPILLPSYLIINILPHDLGLRAEPVHWTWCWGADPWAPHYCNFLCDKIPFLSLYSTQSGLISSLLMDGCSILPPNEILLKNQIPVNRVYAFFLLKIHTLMKRQTSSDLYLKYRSNNSMMHSGHLAWKIWQYILGKFYCLPCAAW